MGCKGVESQVTGSLWKWMVRAGDEWKSGQKLAIIESMKMEIFVESPTNGFVHSIVKTEGELVKNGEYLLLIKTEKEVIPDENYSDKQTKKPIP